MLAIMIREKNAVYDFSESINLSVRALGTRLCRVSLARNSFLLRQGPGPVSCPASSLQSPGCIWRALKRSTLVGACGRVCARVYPPAYKFHRGPPCIFGRAVIFQSQMGRPRVSPISPGPRLSPTPFDRRQNTTRASRVSRRRDAARPHCLGCKFFACISIGTDRYSMGGTSCRPFRPFHARSLCLCVSHRLRRQMHVFAYYCLANLFSMWQ